MTKRKVTVDCGSHVSTSEWALVDMFCPVCGMQGVWKCDEGDYYAGEEHICRECAASFDMAGEPRPYISKMTSQQYAQLVRPGPRKAPRRILEMDE